MSCLKKDVDDKKEPKGTKMNLFSYIDTLDHKSIAVVGIGVSNEPWLRLLLEKGCDVTACDKRSLEEMGETGKELLRMGCKLKLGEDYLEGLDQDVIFRTPGLMPFDPHLEAARERGSLITSEMEVFLRLCPCKVIAITGSDGKTTTTTIISELLKAAGYTVHLGGNIGHPLLCDTPKMKPEDYVVLELSSFQLHSMMCHPDVAVITNLTPNHLDKHKDFQDYIDAKKSIYEHQGPNGRLILNADDAHTDYYSSTAPGKVSFFSNRHPVEQGTALVDGKLCWMTEGKAEEILPAAEIRIPGDHNVLNYLAAFEAVRGLVGAETCRKVAREFPGVAHRLELVRELRGVKYINDSIGSSPTRTIAGLRALPDMPVIICGGYDKHIPFEPLGDELCLRAKKVVLTGATAEKIRDAILNSPNYQKRQVPVTMVKDFREAVLAASNLAEEGDTVLLSPACASFDAFKNFEVRGNTFKKIVMEIE